jgi:abortive infection bacteriophage resistance protein
MTDPVISPDGNLMWTGEEWIPVPPSSGKVSVSLQDSVIAGDVNITQNISSNNDTFPTVKNISAKRQEIITRRSLMIEQWKDDIKTLEKNRSNYFSVIIIFWLIIAGLLFFIISEIRKYGFTSLVENLTSVTCLAIIVPASMMLMSPYFEDKIKSLKSQINRGINTILEDSEE